MSKNASRSDSNKKPSTPWSPLRQSLFRSLWIASAVSNIGTWVHDVGSTWLMTSLTPSPLMIALVQTATTMPVFLFALPAGALADIVDRRRLLLLAQSWTLAAAAALGALTFFNAATPWLLLAFTFMLGMGAVFTAPAWQTLIPELVDRTELQPAIALSSASINIARAVGPALGGLLVAAAGPGAAFTFNALSFSGTMVVLYRWHRTPRESALPAERFFGAIRSGVRYTRHSPALQAVLVRTGVFIIFGSALWAMLPVRARLELGYDSSRYGLLLGSIGIGALAGAGILSKVRKRFSPDLKVAMASLIFVAAIVTLALSGNFAILCTAMFASGIAWIAVVSSFNVAAQTVVPDWVKARAMAVYLLVFQGGMALGALVWGTVATHAGTATALLCAASGLILGLLAMKWYRITAGTGVDLMPSMHWPTPMVEGTPEHRQGPVMITVEYLIDPARADEFVQALQCLKKIRRRDGALQWGMFRDVAEIGHYVETFIVESWIEHLRQHERVTVTDRDLEDRVHAFHKGGIRPKVSHFIYAER